MISSNEAKDLLIESMNELIARTNDFTVGDLTAEINIVAVKYILENYTPQTSYNPMTFLQENKAQYGSIAKAKSTGTLGSNSFLFLRGKVY